MIYQFSMDITPSLPADSLALRDKIVSTLRPELRKMINLASYKGDMLWGKKNLAKP